MQNVYKITAPNGKTAKVKMTPRQMMTLRDKAKAKGIALNIVFLGGWSAGAYYGVKNWDDSGWWKALGILSILGVAGNLANLITIMIGHNEEN